jgi:outer membrane lipoprotein LolB
MKYLINSAALAIIMFVLGGCASFYNPTVDKPSAYVKPQVIDKDFDISGRFSITNAKDNNYGNFTWVRQSPNENLELRSPIGNTVAKITIESGLATLETDGKTYHGQDLDSMLEKNLGFTLPMESLHYWIQGIALPNVPIEASLSDGFIQLGWKVEYLAWSDPNHPRVLQCSRGDLTIKLLLEW